MTKRILVPTDFSPASSEALSYAMTLARPMRAEIVLLHVVEPVFFPGATTAYSVGLDLEMVQREGERLAREQLERQARSLRPRRLTVRTVFATGPAARVITEHARKLNVELIVMATQGRTGLSRALIGSVAERVVRTASCPVLTIHPGSAARQRARRSRLQPRSRRAARR
jgi:universal stress protein A